MIQKNKPVFLPIILLAVAVLVSASAGGWPVPLAQMGMATDTPQPQASVVPAMTEAISAANPTVSIFTGYTPVPESTYTGNMGGTSGCPGMSGVSMTGMNGLGTGIMTTTVGMSGMGGMSTGSSGMNSDGCAMMNGMNMTGSGMSSMNMTGSGTSGNLPMVGMDMSGTSDYVVDSEASFFSNSWQVLGWVLVVVLILAFIVATVLGIIWLINRSRQIHPV